MDTRSRVTAMLTELGEPRSAEELMAVVYPELRRLAHNYMIRERRDHTLEPTALVHEAYLKLVDQTRVDWQGRTHFFAVGARVMRRLLIDHARGRGREKRGAGQRSVTLVDAPTPNEGGELGREELLSLDAALEKLDNLDHRHAQVVELRFFSGLTDREIAAFLGVSRRTVQGDWRFARAWLKRELSAAESPA